MAQSDRLNPLRRISPEQVQQLVYDVELQQHGALLDYVVDPHEIFDFCFPVNFAATGPLDVERIADDQVALYEIFFVRHQRPILPLEYVQETESILRYFETSVDTAYSKMEMVSALIQSSDLKDLTSSATTEIEEIRKVVEEDFNLLLAVSMGIYSLGAELLGRVLRNRVAKGFHAYDNRELAQIYQSYRPSQLYGRMLRELKIDIDQRTSDKLERQRQYRHAEFDANVIDRVIYLNHQYNQAFTAGRLKTRRVVLYLSSASRSAKVFNLPEVSEAILEASGNASKGLSFLRTRSQVFTYVVHRETEPAGINYPQTLINLRRVKEVLTDFRRSEEVFRKPGLGCETCILEGGSPSHCRFLELCRRVADVRFTIERRRAQEKNLGLVDKLQNYSVFLDQKPKGETFSHYLEMLRAVFRDEGLSDWAIAKRRDLQNIIGAKSGVAGLLPLAVQVRDRAPFLRDRDIVTAASQYLPHNPVIVTEMYDEIWQLVLEYYDTPASGGSGKERLILAAYERFIAKDAAPVTKELEGDHELVRCLIYLAFQDRKGDEKAFSHAVTMASRYPDRSAEFYYVACWAGRRAKDFERTDGIAKEGVTRYVNDPRFYHGRSLNTFAWLSDKEKSSECPYTINACIEDTREAIRLYVASAEYDRETLGANYNNLAYFCAYDKTQISFNLDEARTALIRLKECVPKETWDPRFPEYFHTEAHVEYEEFVNYFGKTNDREALLRKLKSARRDIKKAVALYPEKQLYKQLLSGIEKAILRAR